jgi:hypothetical protein
MCMCAALAGADVEHLGDSNTDGSDGNHKGLNVFRGKKEATSDHDSTSCEENYGSNVAVLINIRPDDAVNSKSYPKCQKHPFQKVRSQKLHTDQGQNRDQHWHRCAVDGTSQAEQGADAVAAIDSFVCMCVHSVLVAAET